MKSTSYLQVETLFPFLTVFVTRRLVELVREHSYCLIFSLTVLPERVQRPVFDLRASCYSTDMPSHNVRTDSSSFTKSLHHFSWASVILFEPVSIFPKRSLSYIPSLRPRIGRTREGIPLGIDLRIVNGSPRGSQVASVAQFLYSIWAFLSSPMKNLKACG